MLSRMPLSAEAVKEVTEARDRAKYPTGPSNPGPDVEPATTDSSANGFDSAQPAIPEHRLTDRSDGQVKITEAAEAVEADRKLRSCRARASIRAAEAELDEMCVGAKSSKEGPAGCRKHYYCSTLNNKLLYIYSR